MISGRVKYLAKNFFAITVHEKEGWTSANWF